jgi:hypothetical protein
MIVIGRICRFLIETGFRRLIILIGSGDHVADPQRNGPDQEHRQNGLVYFSIGIRHPWGIGVFSFPPS